MQECFELVKQLSAKKAGGAEAQGGAESQTSGQSGQEQKQKEGEDMDGAVDMLASSGDGLAVEDPDTVAAKTYALVWSRTSIHQCVRTENSPQQRCALPN